MLLVHCCKKWLQMDCFHLFYIFSFLSSAVKANFAGSWTISFLKNYIQFAHITCSKWLLFFTRFAWDRQNTKFLSKSCLEKLSQSTNNVNKGATVRLITTDFQRISYKELQYRKQTKLESLWLKEAPCPSLPLWGLTFHSTRSKQYLM